MNSILKAVNNGYTAQQILGFVRKAFPSLTPTITKAVNAGHSIDQIVGFLSNLDKNQKGLTNENASTVLGRNSRMDAERTKGIVKGALGLGASALGAYALSRSAPSVLGNMLSSPSKNPIDLQAKGSKIDPSQMPKIARETISSNNISPIETESSEIPEIKGLNPEESSAILDKMGFSSTVQAMSKSASPADIAAVLEQHMMTPSQKKWLKTSGNGSLEDIVSQSLKSMGDQDQLSQQRTPQAIEAPSESQNIVPPQQPPVESNPNLDIAKSEVPAQEEKSREVMLPDGRIGSVVSEKNGIIKIDDGGKISHRKADEVMEAPLPERNLADIYEELKMAIPKSKKSAAINWAGYDENVNELAYRPHNGALYVYKNIPPEFAEKVKNAMFKAKTTGKNSYSFWEQGKESRNAGIAELIQELQKEYGGKGKEYIRKYATLVDFLAEPERAVREKKEREAQEKRDEKKRQKSNR